MHFDDRLATVLRSRAGGPAASRTQYRQLIDLLGTAPAEAQGEQYDAALTRLAELDRTLPPRERARIVAESGPRLRSPRLVATLAASDPAVAECALNHASLTAPEWRDLIPALPLFARGLVRRRRDLGPEALALLDRLGIRDRGLPPAETAPTGTAPAANPVIEADELPTAPVPPQPANDILPAPAAVPGGDGIGAIVKRIEAYRKARQIVDGAAPGDSPRLPLGEDPVLHPPAQVRAFDFATDARGRIVWCDPGVAPMVLGLALGETALGRPGRVDAALRQRQPLHAAALTLSGAPAIAGGWQIDAVPRFDPLTGAYTGHAGRMRRPTGGAVSEGPRPDSEADRIRQALHELRTPVNAIQGFAEVIQQQLFGPTPHEYRALAAGIAGDAARMLAAFEELERLAKLDSGAMEIEPGSSDLGQTVAQTIAQLAAHTRQRGSGFSGATAASSFPIALAPLETERIVWRLLATLAGVSAPGEKLKLSLMREGGEVALAAALPAALAGRGESELLATAAGSVPQVIAAGVFGVGFALRLVKAEVTAAGGRFALAEGLLTITLPGLTPPGEDHSQVA